MVVMLYGNIAWWWRYGHLPNAINRNYEVLNNSIVFTICQHWLHCVVDFSASNPESCAKKISTRF